MAIFRMWIGMCCMMVSNSWEGLRMVSHMDASGMETTKEDSIMAKLTRLAKSEKMR